jgi:hypothetical protein
MKYWNDDYDTYAAESLEDVKAEQVAINVINEPDFEPENWTECEGSKKIWTISLEDLDLKRMKTDFEYKAEMQKLHIKTLDEVFSSPELKPETATGKAWFMGSTEW